MQTARWTSLVLFLSLLTSVAYAADVTGKWRGDMADGNKASFTLKSEAAVVSGSMLGPTGKELPLTGKLSGDDISFNVASEWQGQPVTLVGTGKVSGDQIQLHLASDNGYWSTDILLKREPAAK